MIVVVVFIAFFTLTVAAYAAPPKVITVPWRGPLNLQHETYDGKQIHLKGVAHNVLAGATATWDPGDGSAPQAVAVAAGSNYGLQLLYTYPNSPAGTPFTATLTVCNPGSECASASYKVVVRARTLNTEINIAIDEALWYLHRKQNRTATAGYWTDANGYISGYSDQWATTTAEAVQAFEINNSFETGNPDQDPYADDVMRGLKYIFSRLAPINVPAQPAGNPDTNSNGIGVYVPGAPRPNYDTAIVMEAIVASKTPNALTTTGPANVIGRTYKQIVQDMVDFYAWGQADTSCWARGGWRYSINTCDADNSVSQWPGVGILAARDLFGCTVPAFVYSENLLWLNYSSAKSAGNYYGFGYQGAGEGVATSPSGMIQLIMDGVLKTDTVKWIGVENRMATNWNSWYRDETDYYSLFALAKAMRLALPGPIVLMAQGTANEIDWFYKDCANPAACVTTEKWGVARTLLRDQNTEGKLVCTGGYMGSGSDGLFAHAMGTIILTGVHEVQPVAVIAANPNPAANGQAVSFDASGSFHQDPSKSIVSYAWDFNNDGLFEATGITQTYTFPNCATLPTPCNYPVTLKVTDNSTPTPLIGTDTITISVTMPPHPPTANAGGPYWVCPNESLTLDGSKSYDIDTSSYGDSIIAYNWELNMVAPYDFAEASGVKPTVTWTYGTGNKDIGLRVTDNSVAIFAAPANLTNDNFTTVQVLPCSITNLVARAKLNKIQLTWMAVNGATSYDIYRSTVGPNSGFSKVAGNVVTSYATYLDQSGLVVGTKYYYRVVANTGVGSNAASATPSAR